MSTEPWPHAHFNTVKSTATDARRRQIKRDGRRRIKRLRLIRGKGGNGRGGVQVAKGRREAAVAGDIHPVLALFFYFGRFADHAAVNPQRVLETTAAKSVCRLFTPPKSSSGRHFAEPTGVRRASKDQQEENRRYLG